MVEPSPSDRAEASDPAEDSALVRSILDTLPDAMVVIDQLGTIRSFSAAAERLFGYSAAEVRGANVRLIRDNVVVHEGKLSTLKRFKDEVKEVQSGQECGMAFENYGDMRVGDVIECYRVETIQRSL